MKTLRDIIRPVLSDIQAEHKTVEVSELWGASKALFLFGLQHETRRPVIIATATEEEAETLVMELWGRLNRMLNSLRWILKRFIAVEGENT